MPEMNRRLVLKTRPEGIPGPENFDLEQVEIGEPGAGEVLVRNVYLSVDPAQRGWVNAVANYSKPVGIGEVMRSFAVGEVVRSRDAALPEGSFVTGMLGWQDYAVASARALRRIDPAAAPISAHLGVLGINGISAYFGLLDVGRPKPGETVEVPTGGMMPAGTDAAVMIEHTELLGETTVEIGRPVSPGQNVIRIGEDIPAGEVCLRAGTRLGAGDLALPPLSAIR